MNSHTKRILIVAVLTLFFGLLVTTSFIHAQSPPTGGLVPCGNSGQASCTLCHLYELASRIINFLLYGLALPAAVIAFLIGGIFMLTSGGNPKQLEMGKAALGNAVIGIIIAFAAWLIINTLLVTLVQGGQIKFAQALPWNQFPSCLPPLSAGPGAVVRQPCNPATDTLRECRVGEEPGTQRCLSDGFWEATCAITCIPADFGKKRQCTVGGCPGEQTCNQVSPTAGSWTQCTPKDPARCTPSSGTCPIPPTGPCSIASIQSINSCFGSRIGEAAQVCQFESSANPRNEGDLFFGTYHSIGLFQINISANDLPGLPCPTAFQRENGPLKDTDAARQLYQDCRAAAFNEATNIAKACAILGSRGWRRSDAWLNTAIQCNLL